MANASDQELLKAQAHVWNQIINYINSSSLKCAVQLGIPEIIHRHGKPMSLSDLTAALPINPSKAPFVYRIMHILVHCSFFLQQNDDQTEPEFSLTLASSLLLKDGPFSTRPLSLVLIDPILTKPCDFLNQWFQNDDPTAFNTAHMMPFWEYSAKKEPRFGELFKEAMARDSQLVEKVIIDECRDVFEGLKSLVDIGGGTGSLARDISETFSGLECSLLELPHVVAGLEGNENLKFAGGDMFKAVPSANAVLRKTTVAGELSL